jgi:alpha-methylacyl-CoA racemase
MKRRLSCKTTASLSISTDGEVRGVGTRSGVRMLEMAGIGPAPFAGMLLADMGAEVLRIDRLAAVDIGIPTAPKYDLLNRNKLSIAVDLKSAQGREVVLRLLDGCDALIEGFRPGVMEKLGLGPEVCLAKNSRLVYGRMTGWGQDGPLSHCASHDINYVALGGALNAIGQADGRPVLPLNLVGDFGGGSLYLAMGVLAAIICARTTGVGQVVDAAITDGVANMLTMHYGLLQAGTWSLQRGANLTDGGAPFYDVYETSDGLFVTIGSFEAKFYAELLRRLGLEDAGLPPQADRAGWSRVREVLTSTFKTRTRAQWCALLEGTDVCFAPVLDMEEAVRHPHNVARKTHVAFDGVVNPAPAPRFSATPSGIRNAAPAPGQDTDAALAAWGFQPSEIDSLKQCGAVR